MEFFASFDQFYNMGKKKGGKKSHRTKNLKFANIYIEKNNIIDIKGSKFSNLPTLTIMYRTRVSRNFRYFLLTG